MGTTLTGTTPQDTYDSLIKVTDNGPLTGSLKTLTDGLGNDSALALSTGAASVTGTLEVSSTGLFVGDLRTNGNFSVGNTSVAGVKVAQIYPSATSAPAIIQGVHAGVGPYDLAFQTSGGNVGIGTSSPTLGKLVVKHNSFQYIAEPTDTATFGYLGVGHFTNGAFIGTTAGTDPASDIVRFGTGGTERFRITNNGVTFNGDTAAANALDDYEEGTWTIGVSFGEASVGVTTSTNTGSYTKIGRQVTVNGYLELSSKGSSTGAARITGLPFTIGNTTSNFSAPTLRFANIAFINQFQGYGEFGATTIRLQESTSLGVVTDLTEVEFANNSGIILSFTYFV